ncbi:MAG TPA: hypothetical protein VFQ54_01785 [Thermomicrobiales bacterium]|nr:hypothetical protein [Thermomicrobiales bacterium]
MAFANDLDTMLNDATASLRKLQGLKIAQLLGRGITPDDGFGEDDKIANKVAAIAYGSDTDTDVDALLRLASVNVLSKGDGLIATILGDQGQGIPILLGRIAKGKYDNLELIYKRTAFATHVVPVQASQTDYIDDKDIVTTVNIPTNTNTTILMFAYAQARVPTTATQLDMRLRIGEETTFADPSTTNFSGAVGPPSSCGKDTSIQSALTVHARTFSVSSDTVDVTPRNINIRWSCFGGAGNTSIRQALMFGVKVVW